MSTTSQNSELVYSSLSDDLEMAELIDMFVAEIPERILTLKAAFGGRRLEELRRAAHQLKGAAGSYGFAEVTKLAAQLEDAIRYESDEDVVQNLVQELVDLCCRMRTGIPDRA